MTKILITGGHGFLGRNLAAHLLERKDCETKLYDREASAKHREKLLLEADIIFHLAGVNRSQDPADFVRGNTELTEQVCQVLQMNGQSPKIIFSSSVHAEWDTPYGASKAEAERALLLFSVQTGARVRIYRLMNLFGKWCRPNYNSVTATFCHNIANDLPITVSDPAREVELSYVDDVVAAFITEINAGDAGSDPGAEIPKYKIELGDLAGRIQAFHEIATTLALPDFADTFNRALYATYLSYVPVEARQYNLRVKADARGSLAEFVKQAHFGQMFVSRTWSGVTRGNHYHHTKAEKFLVVEGEGLIRIRAFEGGPIKEYHVSGSEYQVIDVPPGFTHSITNVGAGEMVTLFWSSEIFDPDRTDTYCLAVDSEQPTKALSLENA